MSKADNLNRALKAVGGILAAAAGVVQVVANLKGGSSGQLDILDDGCDWYCDNCGAELNHQFGFRSGGTWVCKSCGYENDVSSENVRANRWLPDERGDYMDVLDTETPLDDVDPEDY